MLISSETSFNKNFNDNELEAPDFESFNLTSLNAFKFPTKTDLEGV